MPKELQALSVETICNTLARSGLLSAAAVRDVRARWLRLQAGPDAADAPAFVQWLVKYKVVTSYQGDVLIRRREGPLSLGTYKVIERTHRGRMAGVYLASAANGQTVAAKVLPPASAANGQILARFQREAHSITKLVHPNCIRAFEAGQDRGTYFIIMERLEGETLADVLKRRGRLPAEEAVRLVYQALQGLQHIHEQGMIHRDLEPANLMLIASSPAVGDTTANCTVKILDIGLGRALFDEVNPNITTSGEALGTPEYRSPEQARDAHLADVRSDIYSLGCVLYHALVGEPPFTDKNPVQLIIKHMTQKPSPLATFKVQAPPGLQQVLDKMLAKDVALRYATPAQAAQELRPLLKSQ